MMINNFQIKEKVGRLKFFYKTFLMANTKFEIILKMLFLEFNNVDVLFGKKKLM